MKVRQWHWNEKWETEETAWDPGCDFRKYFPIEVECKVRKRLSCLLCLSWSIASGQWISSGPLSDWGFFHKRTHRDSVWSEPSDTSKPKKGTAPSAIRGAHPFYHHMCCITALSQGRVWPDALLLARRSPVAGCQVHNWTTRDGKWPLTNDSL